MDTLVFFGVALPPAVADIAEYGQRCKSKIEDACIECPGRFFTQLLHGFCADRTLGMCKLTGKCAAQYRKKQYQPPLFHLKIFMQRYNELSYPTSASIFF